MENTKRWYVALEVALLQFCCSAGVGCFIAHANHADAKAYFAVAGVPAFAAAIFVAVASFFPNLIETPSIQFPLNLSLPLVFCSLLPVSSVLISTPEKGLLALQETLAYSNVWKNPFTLALVYLVQVGALSLLGALSRRIR